MGLIYLYLFIIIKIKGLELRVNYLLERLEITIVKENFLCSAFPSNNFLIWDNSK